MASSSCVQNVFARFTLPITHRFPQRQAVGNPGFLFQIVSPQEAENSWVVATLEHQSLGFPRTLCYSFPTIPGLSLMHILSSPKSTFQNPPPCSCCAPFILAHPPSSQILLNPVSQHVLPTRPVTARMGPGSKSKPPAHQPLLGSLLSTASCRADTTLTQNGIQPASPSATDHFPVQISVSRHNASPTHLRHWPPSCPALRRKCSWHLSLSQLRLFLLVQSNCTRRLCRKPLVS